MTEQNEDDRDEQINERFKIEKINCVAIRTIHKHTAEKKKNSDEEEDEKRCVR